eukprot:IDg1789t1
MQSNAGETPSPTEPSSSSPDESVEKQNVGRKRKGDKTRGMNFSEDEIKDGCKTFSVISRDPIVGKQQKLPVFAKRIKEVFVADEKAPSRAEWESSTPQQKTEWFGRDYRVRVEVRTKQGDYGQVVFFREITLRGAALARI